MDITQIIVLIISVLGLLLTGIFMPYIKTRLSGEQVENVYTLVKIAVYAAEQIFGGKRGEEKKQYVIDYLAARGLYVDVDVVSSELNAMIEAAVYELSCGEEKNGGCENDI